MFYVFNTGYLNFIDIFCNIFSKNPKVDFITIIRCK